MAPKQVPIMDTTKKPSRHQTFKNPWIPQMGRPYLDPQAYLQVCVFNSIEPSRGSKWTAQTVIRPITKQAKGGP